MTDPIHQIDEAYRRATPGEWRYRPEPFDDWGVLRGSDGYLAALARGRPDKDFDTHRRNNTDPFRANADFIALAHNHWPAVMAEIERLRAMLAAKETPHAE